MLTRLGIALLFGASLVGCSGGGSSVPPVRDAMARDAIADVSRRHLDGGHDSGRDVEPDATVVETGSDVALPTMALVRLANWSPDAPGLDFCIAPQGTSLWSGPVLAGALSGMKSFGDVTVVDAGIPVDGGTRSKHEAGSDARATEGGADARVQEGGNDAQVHDGGNDVNVLDGGHDVHVQDGGSDAGDASTPNDSGTGTAGVLFPRVSPYVSLTPGAYDMRVVAGGSLDCSAPLVPDTDDFPSLQAGVTATFAFVGDTVDQGSDPGAMPVVFLDDTTVSSSSIALRFINAVPSVIETSFVSGMVATANAVPYFTAAQFGGAGVDSNADAGALDSNDYLITMPIAKEIWSLLNANGGTTTLVAVEGASIPAGRLATVVAIGGESGPSENAIGILVCVDTPPIVAGETSTCELLQGPGGAVCPNCP